MSGRLSPAVKAALGAATISEDGLTLTLADQLDRPTYQATAKAIEALGGKWNKKAKAHLFTKDVRVVLAGVLGGERLPDKNPLDFYATPEAVVLEMCKRIWPWPNGSRFLEPSAGTGAIVDILWGRHSVFADCAELDEHRAQVVRQKGFPVVARDFLTFTPERPYDYVLMNPPFTAPGDPQAYITHIEHALTCLRPGGQLVAVVPGSFAWLSRKRVADFRAFCVQHAQSPLQELLPGAFKASGTEIATCLIHITKPEEAVMSAPAEQPARKSRKSSKKAEAPVPAEAPAVAGPQAQPSDVGEYQPGDFVVCQIGGETINSGITAMHVGVPLRFDVVNRNGPSTISQNAISCRDDYSPAVPLRTGDLVTLRLRRGELFQVVEPAGADEVVELVNVADLQDQPFSPLSGLRVTRRSNIADLYADLSLPLPTHLQKATDLPVTPGETSDDVTPLGDSGTVEQAAEPENAEALPEIEVDPLTATFDCPECTNPLPAGADTCGHCGLRFVWRDDEGKPSPELPAREQLAQAVIEDLGAAEVVVTSDEGPSDEERAAREANEARFPVGTRVRFPASGEEPGSTEWFEGVVAGHESGISEYCTVDEESGHSTVVKFRYLELLDGPTPELAPVDVVPVPVQALPAEGEVFVNSLRVGDQLSDGHRTLHVWQIEDHHVALRPLEDFKKRPNQGQGTLYVPKFKLHEEWHVLPTRVAEAPNAEEPLAPDLPRVSDVAPGTLGILQVPLHQLVRDNCNVRNHYDQTTIEEMSESLAAEGQLENCTGRWTPEGKIAIVAGETRRRSWLHLREQGRADWAQPVLVHVRELTDAQALRISATENMRRKNMTPLEECEAMLRMNEAGDSVEAIQATFGYRTAQPVADRILVARNLHTEAREKLDAGGLSLAQAFVIARAPGAELQKSMTAAATNSHNPSSAKQLSAVLTRGRILVSTAQFNVEKSGLKVVRDMFDTFEAYFDDKPKALEAQIAQAHVIAERRRQKGHYQFVDVETFKGYWSPYGHKKYDGHTYGREGGGLVITVNTETGELNEEKGIKLKASEKAGAPGEVPEKEEREISMAGYGAAHRLRAAALRTAMLGQTHRALALTVHAVLISTEQEMGRSHVHAMLPLTGSVVAPEVQAAVVAVRENLRVGLGRMGDGPLPGISALTHDDGKPLDKDDSLALYEYLVGLDDAQLLAILTTVVAAGIYAPSGYDIKRPPAPLFVRLAEETGAHAYLARDFRLTDEWLKRYPRPELVALAEEAGLGRALVEDCATQKEMRARILEHADRLHAEGFVPRLVRFPEPPAEPGEADATAAD